MKALRNLAAVLFLAAFASIADAALIKVIAEGTVREYSDPDALLSISEPAPGSRMRIEFTYDDTIAPLPGSPLFIGAIVRMRVWVGDDLVIPLPDDLMLVVDEDPAEAEGSDFVLASTRETTYPDPRCTTFGCPENIEETLLLVADETREALSSGSLSDIPWVLDAWPGSSIIYEYSFRESPDDVEIDLGRVSATVDTIAATVVPAPAAFWLLISALGLLVRVGRVSTKADAPPYGASS